MKKLFRYLWRDKVDLIVFVLVLAAAVQYFFIAKNVTPGFAVLALYCFGVMHRLGTFTDIIKDQDRQIKELNERIFDNYNFIGELIKKYGKPKEGAAYMDKLKDELNQKKP